jgi:hypothetical protein
MAIRFIRHSNLCIAILYFWILFLFIALLIVTYVIWMRRNKHYSILFYSIYLISSFPATGSASSIPGSSASSRRSGTSTGLGIRWLTQNTSYFGAEFKFEKESYVELGCKGSVRQWYPEHLLVQGSKLEDREPSSKAMQAVPFSTDCVKGIFQPFELIIIIIIVYFSSDQGYNDWHRVFKIRFYWILCTWACLGEFTGQGLGALVHMLSAMWLEEWTAGYDR